MENKVCNWLGYAKLANDIAGLDELREGVGFMQNSHHQYDVYSHNQLTGSRCYFLGADKSLAFAGNIHDISKPKVAVKYPYGNGKIGHHFPKHAEAGRRLILEMDLGLFEKWGVDQAYIADLVGSHSIPVEFIKSCRKKRPDNGVLKSINYDYLERNILKQLDARPIKTEDILTLFLADTYSKGYPAQNRDIIRFAEYLYQKHVDGRFKPIATPKQARSSNL
jgi:hypothetical protein